MPGQPTNLVLELNVVTVDKIPLSSARYCKRQVIGFPEQHMQRFTAPTPIFNIKNMHSVHHDIAQMLKYRELFCHK